MIRTLAAVLILALSTNAFGQTQQRQRGQVRTGAYCCAVATQPSSNPFRNPIGQGVPPAASAQPYYGNGVASPTGSARGTKPR